MDFRRERCVLLLLEGSHTCTALSPGAPMETGGGQIYDLRECPYLELVSEAMPVVEETKSVNHLIIKDRILLLTLECSLEDK